MSSTTIDETLTDTAGAPAPTGAFGTNFGRVMSVAHARDGAWSAVDVAPLDSFTLHPGTHALHYGSSCFEGLKAHRQPDGSVRAFRADAHVERFRQSAARLRLPVPSSALAAELIDEAVAANAALTPESPGSLYVRPTLLGTDVTIGAAAHPSSSAVAYVLVCPVGDYLPPRPLTIAVETTIPRTTPQFGVVKSGANYAMALPIIEAARAEHRADQVLFAPGGTLQETGASNVMLLDGNRLLTPALTDAFLHGVTRDSLLQVARSLGWEVEERDVTVDDCLDWIARPRAELILTGTAAVIATVGTLVVGGTAHAVGSPGVNPSATTLRDRLIAIQTGRASFTFA